MKKWTVINEHNDSDTFEVEGDNYGEAAYEALQAIGWTVILPTQNEAKEHENGINQRTNQ